MRKCSLSLLDSTNIHESVDNGFHLSRNNNFRLGIFFFRASNQTFGLVDIRFIGAAGEEVNI